MGIIKFVPTNESETREWFAHHIGEFQYNLIKAQTAFPDYILEDMTGKQYRVEVEFTSDNFILHRHDKNKCDFILCWTHTQELPLPVLELSTKIMHEANSPATSPRMYKRLQKEEKKIDITLLNKSLSKYNNELQYFLLALTYDLSVMQEYLKMLKEPRLNLLTARDMLVYSLVKDGVEIDYLHPYELFGLIATKDNLKFLKIAHDSVKNIAEILRVNMTVLHT